MTPMVPDPEKAQVLLGRVVGILTAYAVLTDPDLRDTLAGTGERLTVHLDTEAMADATRLWHGMHLAYRLCMPYLVQHVTVDSDVPVTSAPVVRHREVSYGTVAP